MKYIFALVLTTFFFAAVVSADDAGANFNAGRIIDDSVMADYNSMNTGDIQRFLESKVTCDTWGTKKSEYGGGTRAQYAASRGWQAPPYYCMTTYKENGVSAAQLIYDKAQKYRISPKVLIVLLQKEQGLITDEWPTYSPQYKTATGYGCPDTAPCDSQYFGLGNQLDWAAKMFRSIMNASPGWYTPYVLGNNYIQYNPSASCGGSTVNIQNRATQALYNYTPYQPNQAALDAGWGTAPCGAYGNRNFYLYYTSWFGSMQGGPAYQWEVISMDVFSNSNRTSKISENNQVTLTPGTTAYVSVKARNTGANVWTNETTFSTTNTPAIGNSSWPAFNKAALLPVGQVNTGETTTYTFSITAPATPGSYYQSFNIHHANSIWLNENNTSLTVHSVSQNTNLTPGISSLPTASSLNTGQTLFSPERHSALRLDKDRLVYTVNFKPVLEVYALNRPLKNLVNQADGNIVLYDDSNKAVWATGTDGAGSSELRLQTDGNLVLYNQQVQAIWSTNTSTYDQVYRFNSAASGYSVLYPSQYLSSADRLTRLILQVDGNLVLYSKNGRAIWASHTDTKNVSRAVLQSDGNLVLYTDSNKAVWATDTDGAGNSSLKLQTDNNLVLYSSSGKAAWASNTSMKE